MRASSPVSSNCAGAFLLAFLVMSGCYGTFGSDPDRDPGGDDDDSSGDDDDTGAAHDANLIELQCLAEASNVTTTLGTSQTVQLHAAGVFDDGFSGEVDQVIWSILDNFGGGISGSGLYTTPLNHGGLVVIEALHEASEISAQCVIEIVVEDVDNETEDPALENPLHGLSPTVDDGCGPILSYPLDGSILARDLAPPEFMWTVPGASNITVMTVTTDYANITVISADNSWTPDPAQWIVLTGSGSADNLTVRLVAGTWDIGTGAFSEPPCEATSQHQLGMSAFGALGSVYYWNPSSSGLWVVGIGGSLAQPWLDQDNTNWCIGCHASNLSNPDVMAFNYGGGNGWAGVVNVADPTNPVIGAENREGNFFALNPQGTRLVRSFHGVLYLDDIQTNVQVGTLPTSGYAVHPDWSPDGSAIVYSSCGNNQEDWQVWNCAIHQLPVLSDGSFGADQVLVPADADWNYYYPSYSPDSSWVAFNRHAGNSSSNQSYNNNGAEVMLVPSWGGAPTLLESASLPGQGNSWPRWGPTQGSYSWLAFSSRRPYGHQTNGNSQVWISAIDLNLAVQGVDPSFPPLWLPGQEVQGSNHTPVWVPRTPGP